MSTLQIVCLAAIVAAFIRVRGRIGVGRVSNPGRDAPFARFDGAANSPSHAGTKLNQYRQILRRAYARALAGSAG